MRLQRKLHAEAAAAPPLDQLYVHLTEGCNLACSHCWISPPHEGDGTATRMLQPRVFEAIVAEAKPLGLSRVKLTGGEPLLHPQLGEILAVIRREALGLTIETNGVLCTDEIAAAIALCRDPSVSVSFDGACAATHERIRGVAGCFDRSLAGARALVRAGLETRLIMTLQRSNAGEAEDLVRLARVLGASAVKFNVLQPTARGALLHARGEALGVGELIALGRRLEGAAAQAPGPQVCFDYPPAFRSLESLAAGGRCGGCGILGILGVLASGTYALCGIGELLPELVFGNAGDVPLAELWATHPTLRELREGLPSRLGGICGRCLMRDGCLGSCLAQNCYRTGSLWGPYWFCVSAESAGLFPPSRLAGPRSLCRPDASATMKS